MVIRQLNIPIELDCATSLFEYIIVNMEFLIRYLISLPG